MQYFTCSENPQTLTWIFLMNVVYAQMSFGGSSSVSRRAQ
jgi:hypothetical protein